MRKERWLILLFVVCAALSSAQQKTDNPKPTAAVARISEGKDSARLPGKPVVYLGEGRISGIRYNSIAPLDERLRALRLPFGEQITRSDFLLALRGSRVEVRSKAESATGRVLRVEQEDRT